MKPSKSIQILALAVACGIQPAFSIESEDVAVPAPPPPRAELKLPTPPPPLDQIIPAPPPVLEDILLAPPRLVQQIKDHVVHLFGQAAPALERPSREPAPVPGKAAKPRPPEPPGPFGMGLGGSSRAGRSLIIPKDDMTSETFAATEEDLNVMAVLLDEAVDHKSEDRRVMGIDIFGGFAAGGARNLFIEGHGAIFILKTKLALAPPTSKKEDAKTEEAAKTEWEEARRKLYGPAEWEREIHRSLKHVPGSSALPYDEGDVNELKNSVMEALKNATNIRGLKGDHLVTVVLQSPGSAASGNTFAVRLDAIMRNAAGEVRRAEREEQGGEGRRASTLMIQAKKSDIDDFAKNGNLESFRKKVKVRLY